MKLHIGRFLFLTWHHLQYCRCWKKTFNKELNYFHSWQYPRWSWKWFALAPSGEWNIFMAAFPRPQLKFSICCFRGTKMLGPNWTNWNIVQQVYKYKNTIQTEWFRWALPSSEVFKIYWGFSPSFQDSCPPRPPPHSRTRWKRPQAFARSQTQTSWKQIMLNNNLGENLEANNVE